MVDSSLKKKLSIFPGTGSMIVGEKEGVEVGVAVVGNGLGEDDELTVG